MSYRADDDGDIWDDETNTVHAPELIAGRISRVQDICRRTTGTDRSELARTVLNILRGNMDEQIIRELA
jgi:hypothetical protein